jgi:hypothetical protein
MVRRIIKDLEGSGRFVIKMLSQNLLQVNEEMHKKTSLRMKFEPSISLIYGGVAPRGRSIERPLVINGYAYLAISLLDNGQVDYNS